ncbi:MAG: FAD-binding oxidoreductase [Planctomycetota bacterium]|nr:FAD-binding oxidoreductase [Planctomycetota bacterium]
MHPFQSPRAHAEPDEPSTSYRSVEAWGMTHRADARVLEPRTVDEVRRSLAIAREEGVTIGPRGTGCSYGDASVNTGGHSLDIRGLNRVLSFDPETGIADCEAGVTIETLWKTVLPHGWWPMVVSGTMFPTLAGALGANIHGKNNFKVGTLGDAVLDFDMLLSSGELRTVSRESDPELFHAAIGGYGLLGVFTRIRLRTKRVHSGNLEVSGYATANLREMMQYFEEHTATADYLVGWIDAFGKGRMRGRGLVHNARYLEPGEEEDDVAKTLSLAYQELPANIMGLFPKAEVWHILERFSNDTGMRLVNGAKFVSGLFEGNRPPIRQSHAAFAFLLDYVPNWKRAYGEGGLIQYQPFVPPETAHEVYSECFRWSYKKGFVPYLGVFKRHRPDPFLMTYCTGGWSMAMDFKVTANNRAELWEHCAELSEIVLAGGGRFYFAKDMVITPEVCERMYPAGTLDAFFELKRRLDPDGLLVTDAWRRAFEPLFDRWCES